MKNQRKRRKKTSDKNKRMNSVIADSRKLATCFFCTILLIIGFVGQTEFWFLSVPLLMIICSKQVVFAVCMGCLKIRRYRGIFKLVVRGAANIVGLALISAISTFFFIGESAKVAGDEVELSVVGFFSFSLFLVTQVFSLCFTKAIKFN